eukprot:c210_g1_i1.p1 GENE.c210_g1_i1~~c210_g1_i1.p1  ORF type:complete len:149 (-),score=28.33 c210_g1_i1:39-446(-)
MSDGINWMGWKVNPDGSKDVKDADPFFLQKAPLKPWNSSDVDRFIKSDPVHGPNLQKLRTSTQIQAVGAGVVGVASAAYAFRGSKSYLGIGMMLAAGAVTGAVVAEGLSTPLLGLHKFSPAETNHKFLKWWSEQQ